MFQAVSTVAFWRLIGSIAWRDRISVPVRSWRSSSDSPTGVGTGGSEPTIGCSPVSSSIGPNLRLRHPDEDHVVQRLEDHPVAQAVTFCLAEPFDAIDVDHALAGEQPDPGIEPAEQQRPEPEDEGDRGDDGGSTI